MYLFAQPEVVVSELCPVCFLKEAKHIEAGWLKQVLEFLI